MLNFKLLLLPFILCVSAHGYFLDYLKMQHAGEIGELALGVGKKFNRIYSLDYMHGIVREETGGTTIETIALKNNFQLYRFSHVFSYIDLYSGLAAYHVTGLKYQASRNNNYPERYYRIGSIRGLFYLGLKGALEEATKHEGFFEAGINDIWIENYVNSPSTVNLFGYVSLALGYSYIF
ncbi:MAG: hypothetical protein CMJ16_00520 [Peredibacter sp.]|nr:hypothetical protein [Peredibacter sp.]|tara:strand:- start:3107 stop:3643 length:537 start_codon:yes stop_codon:yes gene_type:complete